MIPVEQRQLWRPVDHSEGPQAGDCLRACVASIFEVPYEETAEVNGDTQSLFRWIAARYPGIGVVHRRLDNVHERETLESYQSWPATHHERGYWIGGVWSPRIPDIERFGCGCADKTSGGDPDCQWCHGKPQERFMGIDWGLHAVVMKDGSLAWDPHPIRTGEVGPFIAATTFVVLDPALL